MVRILLDDDNETNRKWLSQELGNLGHICVDGISARQASTAEVLIAVNPAPENLFSAHALPVICCYTANPGAEAIATAIANGAAEVLVMPFSQQLLQFKLDQVTRIAPARAA